MAMNIFLKRKCICVSYTSNSGLTTTKGGITASSEFGADLSTLRSKIGRGTVSHGGYTGVNVDDAVSRYQADHPGDSAGLKSFMKGLASDYGISL